jgi:hypothetical protein
VTHWGDQAALAVQYWTFPLYIMTTTATAATVQSFLTYRFWTLFVYFTPLCLTSYSHSFSSRNKVLTGVFCALVLTAAAGGTYTMFTIFLFPTFAERFKNIVSAS